jgi:sulfate-transporting ATPase
MTSFLQFTILGLGPGATYALLALGIVLIYRGSGIVNFAHGGFAMIATYVCFLSMNREWGWSVGVSMVASVAIAVLLGVAFQLLILHHLRRAAPLVRVIATLGLLVILQAFATIQWSAAPYQAPQYLPSGLWHIGDVVVQQSRMLLLAIAIVLTAVLWAVTRFTTVGLAISASAQNERAAAALGWSPNFLAAVVWGIGGALAGLAGVLIAPLSGLTLTTFTIVVTVSALAAALLGGFRSFWLTLVGGLFLGVLESLITRYQIDVKDVLGLPALNGANRAMPFIVIIVVLVVRGQSLPLRSHPFEKLPDLGSGTIRRLAFAVAVVVTALLALTIFDASWADALNASLIASVFITSIVVLTGFAGQLSLAQYVLGGIGALIAGRLVASAGWPFELAIPTAVLLTIPAGLLFALPALRTRGINLAVVTLGLGFTVQQMIFNDIYYTGGNPIDGGTAVGEARLFGIDVSAVHHPQRWSIVCLVGLVVVVLVAANLRRSWWGRRLIAVRTNERAAASLGISVFTAKIYAFGVAAAIAALGGILLAFQVPLLVYGAFSPFASIEAVSLSVIGGIGWVLGTVFGAQLAVSGIGAKVFDNVFDLGQWVGFIGGVLLLVILMTHPNGLAEVIVKRIGQPLRRLARSRTARSKSFTLPEVVSERVQPATLVVNDMTVRFGGVVALEHVSLTVNPGEVVGVIGPNGAGKTTLIDAITGFVSPADGTIELTGQDVGKWSAARRARNGLRRSFQSLELFEDITVLENLHAGSQRVDRLAWITDLVYPRTHPLTPTAVTAVRDFNLADDLQRRPDELPYGSRRLVAIARAVASGPSVLLLDEPASGLGSRERSELATLIRSLANERGVGILLVEHDVSMVLAVCDRIVVLDFGRKIAEGVPSDIESDALVRQAYLG